MIKLPTKGDWIHDVKKDLKEFEITLSFEEISVISKKHFKLMVKKACKKACFKSLELERENQSKGREIKHFNLQTASYFQPGNGISVDSMRWIFSIRSRDLAIKGNFPGAYRDTNCVVDQSQSWGQAGDQGSKKSKEENITINIKKQT